MPRKYPAEVRHQVIDGPGHPALASSDRLADLDQVAVRIPDVAAVLGLALLGRREELGPTRAPLRVDTLDVRYTDV